MSTNCSGVTLFAIGQRFADVNFFKTGQADDVAGAGVLQLDLSHPGKGIKPGHVGALAAAIAMNADDRIAHADASADDAPKRDPPEVIAVVEIRNEHLKDMAPVKLSAAAHVSRSPRNSGVMSSLFSCSSRMAKPFFALA